MSIFICYIFDKKNMTRLIFFNDNENENQNDHDNDND